MNAQNLPGLKGYFTFRSNYLVPTQSSAVAFIIADGHPGELILSCGGQFIDLEGQVLDLGLQLNSFYEKKSSGKFILTNTDAIIGKKTMCLKNHVRHFWSDHTSNWTHLKPICSDPFIKILFIKKEHLGNLWPVLRFAGKAAGGVCC